MMMRFNDLLEDSYNLSTAHSSTTATVQDFSAQEHVNPQDSVDLTSLLVFDAQGNILPNCENNVLDAFLRLLRPRMDPSMHDFFHLHLPLLMSKCIRPLMNTQDPCWSDVSSSSVITTTFYPLREQDTSSLAWIQSLQTAEFLCSSLPENRLWVESNRKLILSQLMNMLLPSSQGDLRHFKMIFVMLIQRFPDLCLDLLQENDNASFERFYQYICDSNISDCLFSLVFRSDPNETREERQARFYSILSIDLMDRLFRLLKHDTLTVQEAASELLSRCFRESASTPDAHILFMNLIGDPPNALADLMSFSDLPSSPILNVFHAILTSKSMPSASSFPGWVPVKEPKLTLIRYLLSNLTSFCHHLMTAPKMSMRISVMECLLEIMDELPKDASHQWFEFCEAIPWSYLSHGFFNEFKNNSIFHAKYFGMLDRVLNQPDEKTLLYMLESSQFLAGMTQHYYEKSSNKGHMLLVSEKLKRVLETQPTSNVSEFIRLHSSWIEMQKDMELEFSRQREVKYPAPTKPAAVQIAL